MYNPLRDLSSRFVLLVILAVVCIWESHAEPPSVVVESRLANGITNTTPLFLEIGNWTNSTAKSTVPGLKGAGSRYSPATNAAFKIMPTLTAGGTYSVEVTQSGPATQSGDIVIGISQVGCTGLPASTVAFQRTNSNAWKLVGNITLNEGVTTPEITFSYLSGTLNSTNGRFYSDSVRFVQQEKDKGQP